MHVLWWILKDDVFVCGRFLDIFAPMLAKYLRSLSRNFCESVLTVSFSIVIAEGYLPLEAEFL